MVIMVFLFILVNRKEEAPRLALEAKCSSPVEVLALQGGRLFGARELGAGARQSRKAEAPRDE
jgi:hypothetical protein